MAGLRGRGILTKNRTGKGGGAGDGSDYFLQLRISVLEQVVMHSYHIDGEGSLAGWSLFSLNFEVSWPFRGLLNLRRFLNFIPHSSRCIISQPPYEI